MEKFRWCFVGTGAFADAIARTITESGKHELASVWSRREESREAFANKFNTVAFDTVEEAIAQDDVDGVYVVTPHNVHHKYSKIALKLGKPVLCEKALTVNTDEARDLIETARENDIYLAEAMWTWFGETANTLKAWIDEGKLGEIKDVNIKFVMPHQDANNRLGDPERAGGAILDIGVYAITYAYRLFGYPVEIVNDGRVENGIDIEDKIKLTFENGLVANIYLGMGTAENATTVEIIGDKGRVFVNHFNGAESFELERFEGENETFEGQADYVNEFDIVASEIEAGLTESKFVTHKHSLDVMQIMDECRRQIGLVYPME